MLVHIRTREHVLLSIFWSFSHWRMHTENKTESCYSFHYSSPIYRYIHSCSRSTRTPSSQTVKSHSAKHLLLRWLSLSEEEISGARYINTWNLWHTSPLSTELKVQQHIVLCVLCVFYCTVYHVLLRLYSFYLVFYCIYCYHCYTCIGQDERLHLVRSVKK